MIDDVAAPFGSFMEALPHWAFIIIHTTLFFLGYWLSRKAKHAGLRMAASGFLLFMLAELSYISYHAGLTHFLFAHITAEVCDALAVLTIGLGLAWGAGGLIKRV